MKGLILMQGGRQTVVPDTPETRKFWQEYNTNIARSSVAHRKYVTIIEADADTVEKNLKPARKLAPRAAQVDHVAVIGQQAQEISQLKSLMLKLLTERNTEVPSTSASTPSATEVTPVLAAENAGKDTEFANFD